MHAKLLVALHAFIMNESGDVLLLKRENTGVNDGWWSVPAGRLDEGERATRGVVREAEEEAGIRIDPADLGEPLVMHHKDDRGERVYFFFKTTKWEGEPENREPEKCGGIAWHDIRDPSINVLPHVKKAFELMESGVRYCEYGFDG
jgi:8-oxo-dGTP pyrophosphatase MutT (NUDIX family)